MIIDDALIAYLEELSRLKLTDEEKIKAKKSLKNIINFLNKLEEVDTEGLETITHPFSLTNNLREDVVKESYDRTLILSNAPAQKDGYFKVPKTVE